MGNIAFIPFRKGSKSLPDKNMRPIGPQKTPLYLHTLQEVIRVKNLDKIVLATDYNLSNLDILNDDRIIWWDRKNMDNTNDESSTELVISDWLFEENIHSGNLVLIQITNPFFKEQYLTEALEIYSNTGTLFSGVKFHGHLWEQFTYTYIPKDNESLNRKRRQDRSFTVLENGSFYIFKINDFVKTKNRFNRPIQFYQMPKESMIELDDQKDFEIAEKLLKSSLQISSYKL